MFGFPSQEWKGSDGLCHKVMTQGPPFGTVCWIVMLAIADNKYLQQLINNVIQVNNVYNNCMSIPLTEPTILPSLLVSDMSQIDRGQSVQEPCSHGQRMTGGGSIYFL